MSSPIMSVLLVPSVIDGERHLAAADVGPPEDAVPRTPARSEPGQVGAGRGFRYGVLKLLSSVTPKKSVPQL